GCSENLKLLQLIIKTAKRDKLSLGVVFIDLAKAFDSVSHSHINAVLKQKGVDVHIINLISNLYNNIVTSIK
ncbi:PO21 protein, partial [Bucco capensis]|nr:PO21 protein [Bucco capensis]